jgi:hypothetical protein
MHKFSVSKDMKIKINNDRRRKEVAARKVAAHLCLTLIIRELKLVLLSMIGWLTTLSIIKN